MQRLILNEDVKPLSEFRSGVASCVRQVRKTKRPIVITHHGRSTAVLLDVAVYEGLLEKMDVLQDIRTAEDQLLKGKGVPHAAAFKEVMRRVRG